MPEKRMTRKDIEQLFNKMMKAGWNMDQELSWGYFFKHGSTGPLKALANELVEKNYTMIDINQSYPDKMYWLQIEKIELHSIDSLNRRNQAFYRLAKEKHIHAYDGMDVSPVDSF